MWHIGQRVVCVDDSNWDDSKVNRPIKGIVYTIRSIESFELENVFAFLLNEVINQPEQYRNGYSEKFFKEHRFRPIDEKRIDMFRAMLKNKEKEKVA